MKIICRKQNIFKLFDDIFLFSTIIYRVFTRRKEIDKKKKIAIRQEKAPEWREARRKIRKLKSAPTTKRMDRASFNAGAVPRGKRSRGRGCIKAAARTIAEQIV